MLLIIQYHTTTSILHVYIQYTDAMIMINELYSHVIQGVYSRSDHG